MDIPTTDPPNKQHPKIDYQNKSSAGSGCPFQPNFYLPNSLIEQATRCYALGDLLGTLLCYDRLVEIEPENNVLHANKSAILLRMERGEEALEAANKAIELGKSWPKAHFRKGEALFALGQAEEAIYAHAEAVRLSQGEDRQFRNSLLKSVEMWPQAGGAFFSQLISQPQLADLEEGDCFTLFSAIAESFLNAGQCRIAAKLLRIAIQFPSPNAHISLVILGQLALAEGKMGNWAKAVELMEMQLEIALEIEDKPIQCDLHGALADLLVEKMKKNLEMAIWHKKEQLRIATEINSELSMEIRNGMANLLLANGHFVQSQQEFKSVLQQQPSNPKALLGLGRVFLSQGDLSAALALFIRVERLESEEQPAEGEYWREEAIMLRAKCQFAKGEMGKTLELVQKLTKNGRIEGRLGLKAEMCGLMCQIELVENRLENAKNWAKRQLKAGIELGEENVQGEALNLLLNCYAECGEWLNAEKIGNKLWELVEAENLDNLRRAEILKGIGRIWRIMEKWEKARKIMKFRLEILERVKDEEWAKIAMELADLELKIGEKEKCKEWIQEIEEWLHGKEENEEGKLQKIAVLKLKAEMEWQSGKEGKERAKREMETALMLAQERELTGMEAGICAKLGEWAEEADSANEDAANIYLKQAIGLGKKLCVDGGFWWARMENAKMLLCAFSALNRVLIRQCRWEDAFFAVRGQLRLQRELGENSRERTRTMLLLGKILMENGILKAAEKILEKVTNRAKLADGMEEELELSKETLIECRRQLVMDENDRRNVEEKERDYVNLKGKLKEETLVKKKHARGRNYRVKAEHQRRSFCGYESEQSESTNCLPYESDAESTISGAFVLGVDVDSEEENDAD